ncbi:MAG: hypothetical protein A2021_00830 [Elusimicrobia bacterium GWF2_52_66]|nr:MAG: hypothetical protein A2X33_06945 [Elusimicrobia bacterium GWA2_51_34]OGR85681.1 MAG: hypothetical protein A2021_00830 [Elusimicrobia bacterium GWF2_52_66]
MRILFRSPFYILHFTFCIFAANLRAQNQPTIEEKAAQLLMISIDAAQVTSAAGAVAAGLGGVQLQWGSYSLEDTRRIADGLQQLALENRLKIPLFIAIDYEGGSVYSPTTLGLLELPTAMMIGAADDERETASLFYLAGKELKRAGVNMAFGPVLDVNIEALNPIIGIRSIGSNPELVSRLGGAVLNGFKASGVTAVAKHFPGHGATRQDSHKTLPVVNAARTELETLHLPPFKKAVELNAPAIMTAHVLYPALDAKNPATLSRSVIMDLLKKQMGFRGLVVTDSLDMKAIISRESTAKAAARALASGADLLLIGKGDFSSAVREIAAQVRAGRINETRLNDAYYRVYAVKKEAGLFSPAEASSPFDKAYLDISRAISRKALTLVTDKNGFLPLNKIKKTAVIIFAPQRFAENSIELYKTLLERGYQTKQYFFDIGPGLGDENRLLEAAKEADVLVIGSFQWAQAQNKKQQALIHKLLAAGKPAMLLSLMNPYDLANYPEASCAAAVYGITKPSMRSVADLLTGTIKAGGMLPVNLRVR